MQLSVHVQLAACDGAAARGIATLLATTPAHVPLAVGGPAAPEARDWLASIATGDRLAVAGDPPPGAVALVEARTCVAPGWLDGLAAAAGAATGPVGTVSPLVLGPGPTALEAPAWHAHGLTAAAAAVRAHAVGVRPRVAAPSPACMLVTAAARELAGPLDAGFGERCSAAGLLHIVADDVLVAAGDEPEPPPPPLPEEHEWRRDAEDMAPLGLVRTLARRAISGLRVTVDGRVLCGSLAGTQVHTLELIAALHRTGAVRLRVVVPPDLLPEAAAVLDALAGVELLPAMGVDQATPRTEIVHRPYQVSSAADAKLLRRLAPRRVITHQDLLGYHNPRYHASADDWQAHRRITRAALAAGDLVAAFSRHVAADLLAEGLADPARIEVVPIGVDHELPRLTPEPVPPAGADALAGAPFLLCLGADLRHKNRPFALALLGALRDRGWEGRLVLAGAPATAGGTVAEEHAWLEAHPEHRAAIVDLGAVGEPGKAWLYAEAAAVLYPTVSEGFGLIPFEASAAGTPCLHAGGSSLDELLPGTATLVPWDADASADRALAVLREPARAEALVARVTRAGAELTWNRTATQLITVYEAVLRRPATPAAATAWTALAAEDELGHLRGVHAELIAAIGPTGIELVGEERLLPAEAQRALAGLARRPLTRGPLLRLLAGLYRVAGRE